jgi:hypothetical protein
MLAQAKSYMDRGWRHVRLQVAPPGVSTYGALGHWPGTGWSPWPPHSSGDAQVGEVAKYRQSIEAMAPATVSLLVHLVAGGEPARGR